MIKTFFIGIIIGIGMIMPGVSGSILAISFGVYGRLIRCISNFKWALKNDLKFLVTIACGIGIGILTIGKIILFFYTKYETPTRFAFLGIILGGLPIIFRKIENTRINIKNIVAFILSLIVGILLFILDMNGSLFNFESTLGNNVSSYIRLFITGVLYSIGKIIPGISSSFLLMLVGMYNFFLKVVANPFSQQLGTYFYIMFIVFGFITGAILLSKLITYLIDNHEKTTYSAILGFTIGTLPVLYSSITFNIVGIISVLCLIMCFGLSYNFSK